MKCRSQCSRAHRCIDHVMQYLCGRPHHYDLVFEKRAISVIGMPEFWIEHFVERTRFVCVDRTKANHVAIKTLRDVTRTADFRESPPGKRFVNLLARMRRQPGQLPISHMIKYIANFSVDGVSPEIHEPYAIILELRRRNQRIVWRNGLRSVSHIKIGGNYYFVAIAVERGMKCGIPIFLLVKHHVEHHHARTRAKQTIE